MGLAYVAMWQLHKQAPEDPKQETSISIVQSEKATNETAVDATMSSILSEKATNETAVDSTLSAVQSKVGQDEIDNDVEDDRVLYNFLYFLGWSLVFYLGLTIFSVPYVAMGYEISDDFHERTQIMAIAQFIGQWAWVIAPWFWVILYDPNWFPEGADAGVRELSVWVAIPCTLFALVPALFIKSKSTLDRTDFAPINAAAILSSVGKIFSSAFEAFRIRQFRQIAGATFLIFNSFNIIASYTFLIIVHYLFNSDPASAGIWPAMHGSVGALVTTFLVIPLVTQMSKVLGKKRAFIVCQLISIVGYICFWFLFVPGKPHLFLFALPFHSFGIGSLFTIMMSMTADVCDLDELQTGKRREGVLGAVFWWMVKLGFGVAALLSGFFLDTVGFDAENVTESAVTGMRLFYTLLPIAGVIGAILIMKNYDISEEKAEKIKEELLQIRSQSK
ncbi:MAG: MFS transporter [Bacteroidetes bacterium]|nr:MFS transporter [Bacteroidota bacterium]